MRAHAAALGVLAVLALPSTSTATPPTPPTVYTALRACMLKAGATRVVRHSGWGGTAYFLGNYKWLSWSYVTVNGGVLSTMVASTVEHKHLAAWKCLKPYGVR